MSSRTGWCVVGLVVSSLLLAVPPSRADDTGDRIEACMPKMRSYENGRPTHPVRLEARSGSDGELLYIGVRHTLNPTDPQIYRIESEFEGARPTRVFFEGHDSVTEPGREETVRRFGAAGLVRFLAADSEVVATTLEPSPEIEARQLASRFRPNQIQLFFLLREVVRLRDRHHGNRDDVGEELERILAGSELPGIPNPIATLDDLDRAFWDYWSYPRTWWDASVGWFDPFYSSAESGGVFTNEIARESARIRDENMVRVLARAVLEGERILAVVGRDHVAIQAPALRCAIE